MSDRGPFLQNHDIVPVWSARYNFGSDSAYTLEGDIITLKNTDHVSVLLESVDHEGALVNKTISFWSCSGMDGSDYALIEPIYFRQKDNDGSDTWGAMETVADGYFDLSDSGHCTNAETYNCFLFEFEGAEIWQEGVDSSAVDRANDCMYAEITSTNTDNSDCILRAYYILHPLRSSNPASTSFDNRSN